VDAPLRQNPSVVIQQIVVGAVPIRIGEDRARWSDGIEKGADQRIRTIEEATEPAHGGMHHDHVARFDP
jgi:hypothetical protein